MATFWENLRNAISQASEGFKAGKGENELFDGTTDHPYLDYHDWTQRHRAAYNSEMSVQQPEGSPTPSERNAYGYYDYPLTWREVQQIRPYKQFFDMNMDLYSKEPDQDKRIKLLDTAGNSFLGRLPGMGNYLRILRNTEDAVKREGNSNYDYSGTAKRIQESLNGEIDKFNPRA